MSVQKSIENLEKLVEELEQEGFQFNTDEITESEELALYVIHKLFRTDVSLRRWVTTVVRACCNGGTTIGSYKNYGFARNMDR